MSGGPVKRSENRMVNAADTISKPPATSSDQRRCPRVFRMFHLNRISTPHSEHRHAVA